MVEQKEIKLLLHLNQKPEKATPMDFEWLAKLLSQYPDFDLLRKVFVQVGQKFGAKSEAFEKETNLWELKNKFYESPTRSKTSDDFNKIDELMASEKLDLFIKYFTPIHWPQKFA
jgi:hypothetical protein